MHQVLAPYLTWWLIKRYWASMTSRWCHVLWILSNGNGSLSGSRGTEYCATCYHNDLSHKQQGPCRKEWSYHFYVEYTNSPKIVGKTSRGSYPALIDHGTWKVLIVNPMENGRVKKTRARRKIIHRQRMWNVCNHKKNRLRIAPKDDSCSFRWRCLITTYLGPCSR